MRFRRIFSFFVQPQPKISNVTDFQASKKIKLKLRQRKCDNWVPFHIPIGTKKDRPDTVYVSSDHSFRDFYALTLALYANCRRRDTKSEHAPQLNETTFILCLVFLGQRSRNIGQAVAPTVLIARQQGYKLLYAR
jgi:hypothetical protein